MFGVFFTNPPHLPYSIKLERKKIYHLFKLLCVVIFGEKLMSEIITSFSIKKYK